MEFCSAQTERKELCYEIQKQSVKLQLNVCMFRHYSQGKLFPIEPAVS